MPNIFDGFLKQVTRGDNIKDYQHAARLFVDNNYERSPKYTWLFHVYFDLNPAFTTLARDQQIAAGILVKSAELPRFRIDTKTLNNYNRPSIVQSKIRYEDINISFHDDSSNIIRKLWFDYYNFYYRDADNNYGDATGSLNQIYLAPNKQVLGRRALFNKFGYSPKSEGFNNQFIQAIRIYSLHQKRFSEYTLINPTIVAYRHGTHVNGQDGTLENQMTVSYETVLYASGRTKIARGFADLFYDKSPSPLTPAGGGTNSFLGPGGLVNTIDEVISDGSGGSWGGAAFKLIRGYEKNKNTDFVNLAKGELTQAFTNILRNSASSGSLSLGVGLNQTYYPYRGVEATAGNSSSSTLNTQTTAAPGSVASNGLNITAAAGAITGGIQSALSGNPLAAVSSKISGLVADASGLIKGADLNKVVDLAKDAGNNLVALDSASIPLDSFQAGIEAANQRIKDIASADNAKQIQETLGKAGSFLTGPDAQNALASFQTGTNNLVQQASGALQGVTQQASNILRSTPFANFQFPASGQVASQLGLDNLTQSTPATYYTGRTSTNPSTT